MKVGYNARYHWLKERVLLQYKTRSWVKAVTLSAKLYYVRPFFKLLSSFFSLIENDIFRTSEPGSSNRKTKPRFLNMPNAVIYATITWTETRIPNIENEMDCPSLEGFHAQLHWKFTNGYKIKHS